MKTTENASHIPRRFFTSAALVRSEKREMLRPTKKRKKFFFSPQPPTRGDFHRAVGDKPACRRPRFLCFPRENYFFLCFSVLRYALLHSTTLSSPNLIYPFLRRQLPTANRFVVGKWLSLGCHPIKWSAKGKIGDREKRNAQRHVQNEERRSHSEIGSGHGQGRSGCRYRTLQRGQLGRPSAGERQMPMGTGRCARSSFFGQTDLKGKKNKRTCISPSGENHEKWRIGGWTLYLACIFVYNYAHLN